MSLKKLPLGIQNFKEIVEGGYLYIDKTPYIHKLVSGGKLYFLSRPRRFGKSVLISTLAALFRGERALFEGLYIADHWDWRPRPVLRLDLLGIRAHTTESLEDGLRQRLDEQAAAHGLKLNERDCTNRFRELILALAQTGKVCVLIDEYDKPILDHITDSDRAKANKGLLASFYAVLKSVEAHLDFLFLTGVSKFNRVSHFSDLNNLTDLTLHPNYAGIAGYTESEFVEYLSPYLEKGIGGLQGEKLRLKVKSWYNGYSWDGKTRVYNPVSLLNMLDQRRFAPYWFSTGTPKFLVALLREGKLSIPELDNLEIAELSLEGFEPEKIDSISLLFQTGYLTIQSVEETELGSFYHMGYPNFEVKQSFLTNLLSDFTDTEPGRLGAQTRRLGEHLKGGDLDGFCNGLRALFSGIPYNIFIHDREAYYHTVIYLAFSLIGVDAGAEIQTNKGRIDLVVELEDCFYVMEFKLGSAEDALAQVKRNGYADPYKSRGKKVVQVGIGIDPEQRNITNWISLDVK